MRVGITSPDLSNEPEVKYLASALNVATAFGE